MRVLVTGGAGFIGSHVADLLAASGHAVTLLDDLLPQAHGAGAAPDYVEPHRFVQGDVADRRLLRGLLSDVDAVCHQAAVVGHGLDPSDAPMYALNNDYATAVLLAEMHVAGLTKLVLASSMVVYGEGRYSCIQHGVVPPAPRRQSDVDAGRFEPPCPECGRELESQLVPEDAPLRPQSTYAATKLAQEHLAAAWARQTGGTVWALRYHNVYGPRMPQNTPYAGVASLFRSALVRGEAPTVLEDGNQRRDFVHVQDVARANLVALETPGPSGDLTAVNVCSGMPHTVGELATELAKACGGPAPRIIGGARPADVRHVVADPARAEKLLGFRAAVPFESGIASFATAPLRAPTPVAGT
ncbi:NAD-dependent epimerase/dehydratase family protein [Amycolatopsis acidiphila]|uniref:NAD-dependent epimerase/dehydratase family protein n=1 Tax=Amycolatopsis acidiphila TaxID=715473 RepID=A0A558A7Z7_9PSEU|nr:NAD-dependent epimerase/dehydratase family protein [Amycolatopsis acidiphila]TVT20383.1 NAD-dependent epimerase/dehydratase family protein [Amycolatopsis acidiphila]UIJ59175.1 NAD-dependent epimerase/dehydratase family protein [Amycolatopsis acidiphila]